MKRKMKEKKRSKIVILFQKMKSARKIFSKDIQTRCCICDDERLLKLTAERL